MAEALIKGAVSSGAVDAAHIAVADKLPERTAYLSTTYGVIAVAENVKACAGDAVVLAVKPQDMDEVLASISAAVDDDTVFISIAAGVSSSHIRHALGREVPLVRVMPNTPALVAEGMSALAFSDNVTDARRQAVLRIFDSLGKTVEVDESLMNQVTAVSGSGPAYVFLFAECLAKAGADIGLSEELSYLLSAQTIVGAAKMLSETGRTASELKAMVASPGGTTRAALDVFDQQRIDDIIGQAVAAAWHRAIELDKA